MIKKSWQTFRKATLTLKGFFHYKMNRLAWREVSHGLQIVELAKGDVLTPSS